MSLSIATNSQTSKGCRVSRVLGPLVIRSQRASVYASKEGKSSTKAECRSHPRPECEYSHSDRGRECEGKPNADLSRDPNVSTHIRIAVVPAKHKAECRSQPGSECEHSHSDRGRACGARSRMQIPAAIRMWALTFGLRSCLRITKPNADPSQVSNMNTHIRIAVVPAEHKAEGRVQPRPQCEAMLWDQTITQN